MRFSGTPTTCAPPSRSSTSATGTSMSCAATLRIFSLTLRAAITADDTE
jgi:hypothetical protein